MWNTQLVYMTEINDKAPYEVHNTPQPATYTLLARLYRTTLVLTDLRPGTRSALPVCVCTKFVDPVGFATCARVTPSVTPTNLVHTPRGLLLSSAMLQV